MRAGRFVSLVIAGSATLLSGCSLLPPWEHDHSASQTRKQAQTDPLPPDRVAYPANPLTKPDKDASSSWFGSWSSPKEEKKETSVKDWLRNGKRGNLDDIN
jgi:hypothetical protein